MPVVSDQGGGEFQLPPPGAHPARCVQIIDLGTQSDEWAGKKKHIRRVRIGWELVNEKAVFNEEKGEESFVIGQDYTQSLGERANLRHMLESWRGKGFTEAELKGFDLKVLLGKSCMVNVIHQKSKSSNRTYAQVTSVTPLPKGMQCPKATLEKMNYEITDGEGGCFEKLSDFLKDKIRNSEEWNGEEAPPQQTDGPTDEDEIPF